MLALQERIRLLLIEDNVSDAVLVTYLLEESGNVAVTRAGTMAEAVEAGRQQSFDVILLDLSLPDSFGMETIDRARHHFSDAAIVLFTGLDDDSVGVEAMQRGCQDYVVKGQGDGQSLRRTIRYAIERRASQARMKRILRQTVRAVSLTLELRDPYTAGHQRRVAQLALAIGRRMKMSDHDLEGLYTAALIHDLGKINVPSDFLSRPGRLSEAAFGVVRQHAEVGAEIVQHIEFPWPVADMIRQHHERLDGSGYPYGLKGDQIIQGARILCVADVVEAISSHRPYRPALGAGPAIAEISTNAGIYYDPDVVRICLQAIEEEGLETLVTELTEDPFN